MIVAIGLGIVALVVICIFGGRGRKPLTRHQRARASQRRRFAGAARIADAGSRRAARRANGARSRELRKRANRLWFGAQLMEGRGPRERR
jgi:hypothetical protein